MSKPKGDKRPAIPANIDQEMTMKKFILATALVASILGAAVSAQANTYKYYHPRQQRHRHAVREHRARRLIRLTTS